MKRFLIGVLAIILLGAVATCGGSRASHLLPSPGGGDVTTGDGESLAPPAPPSRSDEEESVPAVEEVAAPDEPGESLENEWDAEHDDSSGEGDAPEVSFGEESYDGNQKP